MENYHKEDVCVFLDTIDDVFGLEVSRQIASQLYSTLNVSKDEQVRDEEKKKQEDILEICLHRGN